MNCYIPAAEYYIAVECLNIYNYIYIGHIYIIIQKNGMFRDRKAKYFCEVCMCMYAADKKGFCKETF